MIKRTDYPLVFFIVASVDLVALPFVEDAVSLIHDIPVELLYVAVGGHL